MADLRNANLASRSREAADAHRGSQAISTMALLDYLKQPSRTGQSSSRKGRTDHARIDCCNYCTHKLVGAFSTFGTDELHSIFDVGLSGKDIDAHELEKAALFCRTCDILLAVLQGPSGNFLRQVKDFEDPEFNRIYQYHSDGVSDIESHVDRSRVLITLDAGMRNEAAPPRPHLVVAYTIKIRTQVHESSTRELNWEEKLPVFTLEGALTFGTSAGKELPTDTRCKQLRKSYWIRLLIERHAKSSELQPGVVPTRLLKLLDNDKIKLLDTDDLQESRAPQMNVRYVALSHRWGISQHLTTTRHSLPRMRAGVHISDLPSTFQDAVFFAHHLGFAYIWIDALCIIQDCVEDWLQESRKMGDIFRNAAVTFAVHCAADDSEGFLQQALSKCDAAQASIDGRRVGIYRPPNPERDVTGSGLSRRGWVLQERFLSRRTLHFTRGRVYWEHADGILCEDGTRILLDLGESRYRGSEDNLALLPPVPRFSPYAFPKLRALLGIASEKAEAVPTEQTPSEWLEMVEMYSHCELTKEADKLIAIAGMGRKIHEITGQAWCAGLWQDRLCEQLLWLPTDTDLISPTISRAPSWSWAARDGPVQYPFAVRADSFEPKCRFLGLQDAMGVNTHWLGGAGRLNLKAVLQIGPGPLRKGDPASDPTATDLPRIALRHYVNIRSLDLEGDYYDSDMPVGWMAVENMGEDTQRMHASSKERGNHLEDFHWYQPPEKGQITHVFLILGTFPVIGPDVYMKRHTACMGIFLEPIDQECTTYRRLGAGQMSWGLVKDYLYSEWGYPSPSTDSRYLKHTEKGTVWVKSLVTTSLSSIGDDRVFAEEELATVTLV